MDDVAKQLLDLRYVTTKTGALHPLQIKNLQMWGHLTIPNTRQGMEIFFDFDDRAVSYVVAQPLIGDAPTIDKLGVWVRELLGPEYVVVVQYKGGQTYRTKRLAPLPNKSGNEELFTFEGPPDE